jgi:hypothetical protein
MPTASGPGASLHENKCHETKIDGRRLFDIIMKLQHSAARHNTAELLENLVIVVGIGGLFPWRLRLLVFPRHIQTA